MWHLKEEMKYFKIIIILLTFILQSCDPGVDYSKIIENSSDYDLWLISELENNVDSNLIEKDKEYLVDFYDHIGRVSEYENCEPGFYFYDTLFLKVKGIDSLDVKTDLNDPSVWTFTVHDNTMNGGGQCECRVIIKNKDID